MYLHGLWGWRQLKVTDYGYVWLNGCGPKSVSAGWAAS